MIHLVDEAMEAFLRSAVPLPDAAIDVSFDAPDRNWGATVNRPTINLFLFEVKRTDKLAQTGLMERTGENGQVERRPTAPIVELRYLATAWASESRDEHQLLGSLLRTVLGYKRVPKEHFPEGIAGLDFITLTLAGSADRKSGDFWSALDGRLKPGLELELGVPVDAFVWAAAGPPTDSLTVGVERIGSSLPAPVEVAAAPRLRRTRRNGALVMEGRPQPETAADPPSGD